MIDNKEKIYPEQKSLSRSESSVSPQDICSNNYDDNEVINYDEIGFDDIDYTTNYFDPTAEDIDMEIEIADLLNRIDSDCVNLIDKDN